MALAGREWKVEECGGWALHNVPAIYYLTPERPNCVVDVAEVWDLKEQAMTELGSQMAFSGQVYRSRFKQLLETIAPGHAAMDDATLGRAIHRETDRAFHLYHGIAGHGRFILAEPYRREGPFQLTNLIP